VLLHLAGKLARDLHRPDFGPKGAAERAFDQARDLALKASEDTHEMALIAVL
jgi:hypothetical protein